MPTVTPPVISPADQATLQSAYQTLMDSRQGIIDYFEPTFDGSAHIPGIIPTRSFQA
jgi:hypothetical protein